MCCTVQRGGVKCKDVKLLRFTLLLLILLFTLLSLCRLIQYVIFSNQTFLFINHCWTQNIFSCSYCFSNDHFFIPNDFSLPEHAPELTKLGVKVTSAEKFHNPLSSSISTTRRRYNQVKSHISQLTSTLYTESVDSPDKKLFKKC